MSAVKNDKQIYIVISQTGTVLSRMLKFITHDDYNHVSIALNDDLALMYSFGRLNSYFPLPGGFVVESPHFGTFKRFFNTKVIVLSLRVDNDNYEAIKSHIENMVVSAKEYHYNYLGVLLAAFKIVYKENKSFYCSEFVRDILQRIDANGIQGFEGIIKPEDFLNLPETYCIYKGKLANYSYCCKGE